MSSTLYNSSLSCDFEDDYVKPVDSDLSSEELTISSLFVNVTIMREKTNKLEND